MSRLVRRFTLASLVAAAFTVFALASAPSAAAQEQLAASCEPPGGTTYSAFSGDLLAQTFTSALTGSLTRAEVELFKDDGSGDWVVVIRTVDDSTGAPTDVALASATIPDENVPSGTPLVSVAFANPATVVAGEQYAITVSRPGAAGATWGVGLREADDCPGTLWASSNGGTTWVDQSVFGDMVFRVFVTPPGATGITCKGRPVTMVGTAGDDLITGTNGPDVIAALEGNDKVLALAGNDIVCGNRGRDRLLGQDGEDTLKGNRGNDTEKGGDGDDRLKGNRGADLLKGKGGEDFLGGGKGDDTCRGGGGDDKQKSC